MRLRCICYETLQGNPHGAPKLHHSLSDCSPLSQPEGLAQQLRIQPKALRAALRYLEQEQFVWRDHRQHKRKRGAVGSQAISDDSTAGEASAGAAQRGSSTFARPVFICLI